ncbi:hypothetical protein CFN78_25590 [Amycolatopsis antarctica]|uniref:Uncharacterized protein n=1 Tax=Amycolatopsis antarctica TaxID=1854586 RepID=A0A263CYX6_9PSEU|nr:hypothetical protein CFN78_25590 [Amycolatopsis antarctica]
MWGPPTPPQPPEVPDRRSLVTGAQAWTVPACVLPTIAIWWPSLYGATGSAGATAFGVAILAVLAAGVGLGLGAIIGRLRHYGKVRARHWHPAAVAAREREHVGRAQANAMRTPTQVVADELHDLREELRMRW